MPLPVVTDHFYVQAVFQRSGNDAVVNTFCLKNHRNVPGESMHDTVFKNAIRDHLDGFYGNRAQAAGTVGNVLAPQLFGLRYIVYDLGQPNGGSIEVASATWPTTAGTGSIAPPDLALVITWRTPLRGRSYRGRTYIGPINALHVDTTGRPTTTAVSTLASAGQKLIGNPATRQFQIAVLSRTLGVATGVTHGDVDNEFDTQRRRGFTANSRTLVG